MKERDVRFHQKHPHYQRGKYREIRKECLEKMGGKCSQCGFSDYRALQVDHINNDGYEERKKQGHNYSTVRNVLRSFLEGGINV